MPVLRAKSPRVEGGRCYPKVCWSAVTRATHWGLSTRSSAPETHSAKSARSAKPSQILNGFPVDWDQGGVTSGRGGDSEANGCRREMGTPRAPAAAARHQGGVHAVQPLPASSLPRGQPRRQARHQPSTPRSATPSRSLASPSAGKNSSNGGAFRTPGTRLRFFRSVAAPPPPACDDFHCDVDDLCDASSASDCSSASDAHSSSGGHSARDSCSGSDDDGACSGTCCIPAGDAPCCLLPCAHASTGAKIIKSAISVPSTRHCGYGVCWNENDASIAKMPLRGRGDEDVTTAACMGALSSRFNGLGARDGGAGRAATPNGHCDAQVLDRCDGEALSPRHPRAESEPSVSGGKDACDRNTAQRGIVCRIGRQQDSGATPMVRQDTFTIERGQGGIGPRGERGLSLPMLSRPLCPSPTPTPSLATLRPRAGQSGTSNGSKLRPPATHSREAARISPARSNGAASAPYSRGALSQPRAASRGGRSRSASENGDLGAEERPGGGANTPPWEPHHVAKGPRGSGNTKRGAPYSRSSVSSDEHDHQAAAGQQKEDPPPHQATHRGRRAMKITLREEATKKNTNLTTPASRTRSGSRSSGGSSPATIHGRAPHKTATVTPAPNKVTPKSGSLNRFGFRSSAQVKSGDSTDSVNSILSDAQTISDSNSNIFELCEEENENLKSTKKSSETDVCDNNDIHVQNRLALSNTKVNKSPTPYSTPRGTPNLQSGRITAFTRQLPKPQVVTVKSSVSPKPQTPLSYSPRPYTPKPHSPKTQSPLVRDRTKSPSLRSLSNTPSKAPLEQTPKAKQQFLNNSQRIPRVSRDSESSTRSGTEVDSGLGSSSESDKIRGEGETDTLGSSNVESTEDMSDAWLRGKRAQIDSVKRRSGNMEVHFNGTGEFELKRRSLECKESSPSEPQLSSVKPEVPPEKKSEPSKEKREGTITYSMARQKFAPYSRGRIGYGYQGTAGRSGEGASSNNSNNSSTNVTKIPGSSGLVRNRVAMLEKTPTKTTPQPPVRRSSLKKPVIRPTSLEKTPILVMPVTEKTVELSKPVCRRLEYSECKNVKSDAQNEISGEIQQGINPKLSTSHPKAEDILIVGSIEVETHTDNNILLEAENHGSYYENSYEKTPLIVKEVPLKHSPENNKANENKAANDVIEKEKLHVVTFDGDSSEYLSETTNDYTDSSLSERIEDSCDTGEMVNGHYLQSPDEFGMKILTPQSESSFEILESLSETVELSTEEARDDYSLTEPEISESKATILEMKRQESADGLTASASGSEGRASTEELSKPPLKPKPKLPSVSPEKLTNPSEVSKPTCIPTDVHIAKPESSQKSPVGSPVDKKKPVGMGMTLVKATDMKSSVDSSIDSPKSTTGNPMVESSDRSTLSGKCTPTLNSGRGDLDQDFLIDDEIADQPGLMFGGSTMASSFFTDDGIFDDLTATSPSHVPLKSAAVGSGRSRANSVDTTSSLGADDLMLDFDIEEGKAGGYDEEVLSPDASEIFSEWTAMMAEVSSSVAERCVSRDGSSGGGRTSRPRLNSSSDVSSPDPRRPTVLRPPRQGGLSEGEGGGVCIDRTSYHYMCQDVTALKTMLLRLRRVLQAADTINPFDANLRNSLYLSLASSDSPGGCGINGDKDSLTPSVIELSQENIDLRRQVVLLQQQLEERDRTIRLLQQQLAQSLASQKTTCNPTDAEAPTNTVNAATQTERSSRPTLTGSSLSRAASIDDGLGPTVSSEGEGDCMGRGRSTSAPEHRQPRAASQPPALLNRHPTQS